MNKLIEILFGLILLVVAIYAWGINLWGFGNAALAVLQGAIIWIVLLTGIILVFLGINDLRN